METHRDEDTLRLRDREIGNKEVERQKRNRDMKRWKDRDIKRRNDREVDR